MLWQDSALSEQFVNDYELEERADAMPEGMTVCIGVPSTLFCRNVPTTETRNVADRILESLQGRVVIDVGDCPLPTAILSRPSLVGSM